MAVKAMLILCAQALLIQSTISQCINRGAIAAPISPIGPNRGLGYDGLGYDGLGWNRGLGCAGPLDFVLPIASSSCTVPIGISVVSENVFEGTLNVIGELPFIGAVALEGTLPTSGSGSISYGCGSGNTGMVSEGPCLAVSSPFVGGIPPAGLGYGCGDILF